MVGFLSNIRNLFGGGPQENTNSNGFSSNAGPMSRPNQFAGPMSPQGQAVNQSAQGLNPWMQNRQVQAPSSLPAGYGDGSMLRVDNGSNYTPPWETAKKARDNQAQSFTGQLNTPWAQQSGSGNVPSDFRFDQDMAQTYGGDSGGNSQEAMYQGLIDELMGKINREYAYDGAGDKLVDEAFQGSLDALGTARTRTNDNYSTSRENIDSLTNSHVANIKGADRDAVNRIGDDLTSSYKANFGENASRLKADRAEEIALKTDMLKRLGIQDAGLGSAGEVQTAAIAENSADQAGAMQQANTYKSADLTRNVEQAQSMANAGVERQSDLRRQLDGILGGLDTQEAGVRNDISTAKLGAQQSDRANFQKEQGYYNDSLQALLSDQSNREESQRDFTYQQSLDQAKFDQQAASDAAKNGGVAGTNSAFDVVDSRIAAKGKNPTDYRTAFNEAMQSGVLDSGLGDKNSLIQQQMMKIMQKKGLDPNSTLVSDYAYGVLNYGTDKLSAG